MDVSIIIVNYNTKALTLQCIDSIFEKTSGITFEVILVDNASTDGSKEVFEEDTRIKYIYSNENLGFGRANNLGYAQSEGDYLFLLNSDTYLVNNAVLMLWKYFKIENMNQNISCAGCMLKDKDGEIVHSYAKFPSIIRSFLNASLYVIIWKLRVLKSFPSTNNYNYKKHINDKSFEVDYITGADLLVSREVVEKCGLFDPDFFMYSEETEMQYRYMQQGLKRIIVNGPEIVHLEGKSNAKHSPNRVSMVMKSQFLYFKKTHCRIIYWIYNVLFKIVYISTYLLCFPFINGSSKDKWMHIKNVITM